MSRCGKKLTATLRKFESGSLADKLWGGRPRPRRTPWSDSANPRKRPTWASAADQGVRPISAKIKTSAVENVPESDLWAGDWTPKTGPCGLNLALMGVRPTPRLRAGNLFAVTRGHKSESL